MAIDDRWQELFTGDIEDKVDIIDNNQDVPTSNSTANTLSRDVIGNKNDDIVNPPGDNSLYGIAAYMSYYHVHSPSLIYPRDADPATLTAVNDGNTWSEGNKVEIIAAGEKSNAYDVHHVILGEISATGDYVVKLYTGAIGEEIFWGECAFTRDTNQVRGSQVPIQGPPVPSVTRMSASLLSGNNNGETVNIKIYTHEYV